MDDAETPDAAEADALLDVTLRVLAPEGDPVVGQTVDVQDRRWRGAIGGPRITGDTDARGVVVLTGLDRTKVYDLTVLRYGSDPGELGPYIDEDWVPRSMDVVLPRYASASGRVVDHEGNPIAGAVVRCESGNVVTTPCYADEGGRFEFASWGKGEIVRVKAMPPDSFGVPAEIVSIVAGGADVVIRIDRGSEFAVRILNWQPQKHPRGHRDFALLTNLDDHAMSHCGDVADDGTVTFRGLRTDARYVLWIPPTGKSALQCYRAGLRAGDGPLQVTLVPGESIEVLVYSQNAYQLRAMVEGPGFLVVGTAVETEDQSTTKFLVAGLPPGEWDVVAESGASKLRLANAKRVRASTGESVEIRLPEPPRR